MAHMWVVTVVNGHVPTHHHVTLIHLNAIFIIVHVNVIVTVLIIPHHSVNFFMSYEKMTTSVCVMMRHPTLILYSIPLLIVILDFIHQDSMAHNFIVIIATIHFYIHCC